MALAGMTVPTSTAVVTDEAIMAGMADGDVELLGELYQRYGQAVRGLLFRLSWDVSAAEAEDLCHEVFLEAYQSARRYRHRDRLLSWLFGIAVRKVHGWRRKRRWRQRLLGQYRNDPSTPTAAVQGPEEGPEERMAVRGTIKKALGALNQGQREVLLMHAVEGLGAEDIAEVLGIRVNTVWTRLHRARRAMQSVLAEGTDGSEGKGA